MKCVEPEIAPNINFDENGVCNYCRSYKKIQYIGEDTLLKTLKNKIDPDKKYDCIVMLSGGRDSSYVLLKLVKDYGMKVLAVNYENPFSDPQARKNIQNAVKILNVDLVKITQPRKSHERTFRNNVKAWFDKPSPAMAAMVCISCYTMWYYTIQIAKKYDINCIVSGGNPYEEISFKKELLNVSGTETRKNKFSKAFFGVIRELLSNRSYFHPVCVPTMLMGYLFADEYCLGSKILGSDIEKIQLFDYIPWNEDEVISRISSELDWDYPHKFNSSWRFDCRISHLRDYMYYTTMGMFERDDLYSKMIREGVMTRDEALRRLEKENKIYYEEIEDLLKFADLNGNIPKIK
jgi:asparagine synthetase B (glutamine-hydrolysing)